MKLVYIALVFCFSFFIWNCNDSEEGMPKNGFTVTAVHPVSGVASDIITITGSNFGNNKDIVDVIVNGIKFDIIRVTPNEIVVSVPIALKESGEMIVSISGYGSVSAGEFIFLDGTRGFYLKQIGTAKEGGDIRLSLQVNQLPKEDLLFSIEINNELIDVQDYDLSNMLYSLDNGKTWRRESSVGNIKIPKNTVSILILIPIVDDDFIEGGEIMKLKFNRYVNNRIIDSSNEIFFVLFDDDSRNVNLNGDVIVSYIVDEIGDLKIDRTISPLTSIDQKKYVEDIDRHLEIWNATKSLIPSHLINRVKNLEILYGTNKLGHVYPSSNVLNLRYWNLGLSVNFAYGERVKYKKSGVFNVNGTLGGTIVHEFGHIMTLNETQIDVNINKQNCTTLYATIERGCFEPDSYTYESYRGFWLSQGQEYINNYRNLSRSAFYNAHKTDFVSEYAATNSVEDIAESIMYFVSQKDINKSNSNSSFALKKLNYLNVISDFKELKSHVESSGMNYGRNVLKEVRSKYLKEILGEIPKHSCLDVIPNN